tara:strand:+ start:915 stop:1445 length:531 start_codon:yes stop_codon:yes gene_type:complete
MNIFYLDHNPKKCAEYHCDKHVVKMILEYGQILSTAHRILVDNQVSFALPDVIVNDIPRGLYKKAFVNHPSTIWARETDKNYLYLFNLWESLCQEYTHRYKKVHLTQQRLEYHVKHLPRNIPQGNKTPIPQCMPDDVKSCHGVSAYRKYYNIYKSRFAKWTDREIPKWFNKKEGAN